VAVGTGRAYVNEIVRAGGAPLLLPLVAERDAVRAMIEAVDGLLLTGGGDVSSLEFGAEPVPGVRLIDPARDRMEIDAIRRAARRSLPILGICRGIQLLNVALGGDLVQDIPTQIKGAIRHWSSDLAPSLSHTIRVEPKSILASLIGEGRVAVDSSHHQAVGRPGKGLRVTAHATDGVVEAIEAEDRRPILGVQFHPEEIAGEHPRFRAIFEWLVKQARRFRRL
jgi:putative glutamine amidotransferase